MGNETDTLEEDVQFEKDERLQEIEDRMKELYENKNRTPEEQAELDKLKVSRRKGFEGRLMKEKDIARREKERADRLERELEEARLEKNKQPVKKQLGSAETIQINGKEFYTDKGLLHLINSGEMTQDDAYAHQEERREERAVARIKQEQNQNTEVQVREDTKNEVLKEHPEFAPNHPKHNPDDPLFREADRIWRNGYHANPRGLKLALEEAKRLLNRDGKRPDLSEEFETTGNESPSVKRVSGEKKVVLSESEKDTAWSYYRTQKNPATGKSFTQAEAIEKATKSKQARLSTRRV